MEDKIEVKIQKTFWFDTGKYYCGLKAVIEADVNDDIPTVLRCDDTKFFGWTLRQGWAIREILVENHAEFHTRYGEHEVKADSLSHLKKEVDEYISCEITKLREVAARNRAAFNQVPSDETVVFQI